jgi:hypothetical protein
MKAPFRHARHAGFFTLGIAIAVLVVCGGLAGGGRLLNQAAADATEVAAESEPRQESTAAREDRPIEERDHPARVPAHVATAR